jgi:hypothetical protein
MELPHVLLVGWGAQIPAGDAVHVGLLCRHDEQNTKETTSHQKSTGVHIGPSDIPPRTPMRTDQCPRLQTVLALRSTASKLTESSCTMSSKCLSM